MATIGRSRAVAMSGPLRFSGWLAWLMWLFVHLIFLIGFRNRLVVLFEWAVAYFSFDRSARIIVSVEEPPNELAFEESSPTVEERIAHASRARAPINKHS
jgi:NADH dehydrogenase